MILSLKHMTDASVVATGGEIGCVSSFLFDDQSWGIRYIVVDVGGWLNRRDVILSVSSMEQPDWKTRQFRASLTREQVRNSPDVDSQKPVSPQQEIAMPEYFKWPDWSDSASTELPLLSPPTGREYPVQTTCEAWSG